VTPNALQLQTKDGFRLAARVYETRGLVHGVALVVPAMAIKQNFYADFANWLAAQGLETITFDFRGIGDSAPPSLRGFEADILTWARQDAAAVLAFARQRAAGRPLLWVGHSLGGQILAMTPGNELLDAAVTIACGSGYWRENAYPLRRWSWWLWHVIVPVATTICGYFPGKRLRMVGDLPRGVIEQWSRWCRNPDYAAGAEGESMRAAYRAPTLPMLSISFTDDEYMSERNIASLHGFYENAQRTMRRLAPDAAGQTHIGHFGYFRRDIGSRLWPSMLEWTLSQGAALGNRSSWDKNE